MNAEHIETGRSGEEIAAAYLGEQGYEILERNYRSKYCEIDIVARQGETLVFVEVRTKSDEDHGTPEETIDDRKIRKLIKSAEIYMAFNELNCPARIDAVCIVNGDVFRLDHYENITG
jgi:putative endonuclease